MADPNAPCPDVARMTVVLDPTLGAIAGTFSTDGELLGTGVTGPWKDDDEPRQH